MKRAMISSALLSIVMAGCGEPETAAAPQVAHSQSALEDPCVRLPGELTQIKNSLAVALASAQSNCNSFCTSGTNPAYARGAVGYLQDAVAQANSATTWAARAAAGVPTDAGMTQGHLQKITSDLTSGTGGALYHLTISAIYDHGPSAYAGIQQVVAAQRLVTTMQLDAALCYTNAYYHP